MLKKLSVVVVCFLSLIVIWVLVSLRSQTTADYNRKRISGLLRVTLDTYLKNGERSHKWDADAVQYITDYAQHFVDERKAKDQQVLCLAGKNLISKGCGDPLILYLYSSSLLETGNYSSAIKTAKLASNKIVVSKYAAIIKYATVKMYAQMLKEYPTLDSLKEYKKWKSFAADYLALSLEDGSFTADEQRAFVSNLENLSRNLYSEDIDVLYRNISGVKNMERWTRHMVDGIYGFRKAWNSRGDRYAEYVTPEGWDGYYEGMAVASSNFIAAWKMNPERPEAAAYMIEVDAKDGESCGGSRRQWFERSTAAQYDFFRAYENYAHRLQPEWCGSQAKMLAFAGECLAGGRFDTDVPFRYYLTVQLIDNLNKHQHISLWSDHNVRSNIQIMCAGYIHNAKRPDRIGVYQSISTLSYWYGKDYSNALATMAQMTDIPVPEILNQEKQKEIRAYGGKFGGQLQQAESIAKTNQEEAAKVYTSILEKSVGVTNVVIFIKEKRLKYKLNIPILTRPEYKINYELNNTFRTKSAAPTNAAILNSGFSNGKTNWYGPGEVVRDGGNDVLVVTKTDKVQSLSTPLTIDDKPKAIWMSFRARAVAPVCTNKNDTIFIELEMPGRTQGSGVTVRGTNWTAHDYVYDVKAQDDCTQCKVIIRIPAGEGSIMLDDVKALIEPDANAD